MEFQFKLAEKKYQEAHEELQKSTDQSPLSAFMLA